MAEAGLFSRWWQGLSARRAAGRRFAGPAGQRLYAIGDVHGRLDLVDTLLALIRADLADRPVHAAAVVFVGDLIDRGPESAGVIERLRTLSDFPARLLFLLGNHEEVLLRVLDGEPGLAHDWFDFGGDACLLSYGLNPATLRAMDEQQIARALAAAMPAAHLAFVRGFSDSVRFGDFLVVHAGIGPGVPIAAQQPHDLRWIREPFLSDDRAHEVLVIHGHTIGDQVVRRPNRIGIDTGAYRTGVLTAAVVEGTDLRFLDTAGRPSPVATLAGRNGRS